MRKLLLLFVLIVLTGVSVVSAASPRSGTLVQAVLRNGSQSNIRVRDCTNISEANPINCPIANIQTGASNPDGSPVMTEFFIRPGTAYRVYRVHFPANNDQYVWVSISPDTPFYGIQIRWWAALCFGSTALLDAYFYENLSATDNVLGIWWEDYQAGAAPVPQSCFYSE